MFPCLDHNAQRVIDLAGFEAWRAGSTHVESGHLLLALRGLIVRKEEQRDLLKPFLGDSVSIETFLADIEQRLKTKSRTETLGDSPHSEEYKRILVYACEEARRLNYLSAGVGHLLFGIMREEGCFAAEILREHGLSPEAVREKLPACEPNQIPPLFLQRAQQVGAISGALFGPPLDTIAPVKITPTNSDRVSATRFDPLAHKNFDASLRRMELSEPGLEKQRPHAVVLTNHSDMAIVVLVIRWNLTDAAGKSKGLISSTDTLYPYGCIPTVAPRSQAAYTPECRIPENTENRIWTAHIDNAVRRRGSIPNPVEGTVTFDTVVFEDGYVVGPDESKTVAALENRKAAADSLIADFRRAISDKTDVSELINKVFINGGNRSKPLEFARAYLATIMGLSPRGGPDLDLGALLTQLANVPAPPRLFR